MNMDDGEKYRNDIRYGIFLCFMAAASITVTVNMSYTLKNELNFSNNFYNQNECFMFDLSH